MPTQGERPRRWAVLAALALCSSCDGCGEAPSAAATAPASNAPRGDMPLIQPWVMGAAKEEVALPPPCRARDAPLTAVLRRESRLVSAPNGLGHLLVAEGATRSVEDSPPAHPALALKRWSPDASGLLTMRHGSTPVAPLPWPAAAPPQLARVEAGWLALFERARGDRRDLFLWRPGHEERLGDATALQPASLRCHDNHCALLTARVNAAGAPAEQAGATLWLGHAGEAAQGWRRVTLELGDARPFAISGVRPQGETTTVFAALADDLRARVVAVADDEPRVVAEPLSPHGLLATTLATEPVVVASAGPRGPRQCDAGGGGVLVTVGDRESLHLRSALPADRAAVHAIDGGALVTWLAPARCDGPRRVLHAAVVDDEGRPTAPVTVVGEAETYAVATSGADVDLWLRRPGGMAGPSDMGTVTHLRVRCALEP